MQELITTFHIDWKLVIAQLINFVIVLFVLYKFAYGPILKMMTERTEKIEKGIENAKNAEKKLAEIKESERTALIEARRQSLEIVTKAEEVATKSKEEIMIVAKEQSKKILEKAEKDIEIERAKMMHEVKGYIAELVVASTGKIIGDSFNSKMDADFIKKSIS